jgi:hypothetical protein
MNINILIITLSVLCILFLLYLINKNRESFQDVVFTSDKLPPCTNQDGTTRCEIQNTNLGPSKDIAECIVNCQSRSCSGCSNYNKKLKGKIRSGKYNTSLTDFLRMTPEQCDDPDFHANCSPCVEACYHCSDSRYCNWVEQNTDEQIEKERDLFKNTSFLIGAIPRDKHVVITWDEPLFTVNRYEIFIYRKANKNVDNNNDQQTPLIVRKETTPFKNTGNNNFIIKGLSNGETYSINVNKISKHNTKKGGKYIGPVIKPSNTIDVVPSKVNLLNYSKLSNDDSAKQKDIMSVQLIKELTGKSFDISI